MDVFGAEVALKTDVPAKIATYQTDPTQEIYAIFEVSTEKALIIVKKPA